MFRLGVIAISLAVSGCAPMAGPGKGPIASDPGIPLVAIPACTPRSGNRTVSINTGKGSGTVAYAVSGQTIANALAQPVAVPDSSWNAALPPAGWIDPGPPAIRPVTSFTYMIRIQVPASSIPTSATLSGDAAADDLVTIRLDGATVIGSTPTTADPTAPSGPAPAGVPGYGYRAARVFSFGAPLAPGIHLLRFSVDNLIQSKTALLVRAQVTTHCAGTPPVDTGGSPPRS